MKAMPRQLKIRPKFCMNSKNPNVSPAIVDCSPYTHCIALKDDYHNSRMKILANTVLEFNYLDTIAKTFNIPARRKQFL